MIEGEIVNKVLVMAYDLNIGGIERALVSLLKKLASKNYDITLLLCNQTGELLKEVPSSVRIETYEISDDANVIKRKIKNRWSLYHYILKHRNKYDFVACYVPYVIPFALIATKLTKQSALFLHGDYALQYQNRQEDFLRFFKERQYEKFKYLVFVSIESQQRFLSQLRYSGKSVVINNMIDSDRVLALSNEKLITNDVFTFVSVARHDNDSKRLDLLLHAVSILAKSRTDFKVQLIGDGPDHQLYLNMIGELDIHSFVEVVGETSNPYPYIKASNALILTSAYEGYPVVYLEALILNKPILTTIKVEDGFIKTGSVNFSYLSKDPNQIAKAMDDIINHPVQVSIDPIAYNEEMYKRFTKMTKTKE